MSSYHIGDTIFYENSKMNTDTILVINIDTTQQKEYGYAWRLEQPAYNDISVRIKHLPIDRWHGFRHEHDGQKTIEYQEIMSIQKFPQQKSVNYNIYFKDFFNSCNTKFYELNKDTLKINSIYLTNYYLLNSDYFNQSNKPSDIECIYWTNEFGLTAFKCRNGEYWTRKNCRLQRGAKVAQAKS